MFAAFDPNVVTYVKTGSGTSAMVSTGEAAIGVGFLHTGLMYIEEGYDNIKLIAPSDGTGYEVGGTAIIEGAKNMDQAKLFMAFAMTPECQEIGQTVGSLQFTTVEGAADPEAAQALVDMEAYGIKVITPTEDEQNALKDRVRAEVWPRLADDLGQDTIDEICEIYGVEL
jgi:ABC-type Fe3+ transport system substrate-binding protein